MTNYSDQWAVTPVHEDSIIEIRAFYFDKSKAINPIVRIFKATDYKNTDDLKAAIEEHVDTVNRKAFNVYINLNPIKSDFTGRSAGKADIDYRDLILLDFDRAGVTKQSATDDEVEAAEALAEVVKKYLSQHGWPKPIKTMSGNGIHLYYIASSLKNYQVDEILIKNFLNALSDKFSTHIIKIDTVVYDSCRITKFLGTIMRKGEESQDRPYRRARLIK